MRRALNAGDLAAAAAIDAAKSTRGVLLEALQRAVADERFREAAELAVRLQIETARRLDVTQDEGSYDRYLDQDEWYAQARRRSQSAGRRRGHRRTSRTATPSATSRYAPLL